MNEPRAVALLDELIAARASLSEVEKDLDEYVASGGLEEDMLKDLTASIESSRQWVQECDSAIERLRSGRVNTAGRTG